MTGTRVSCVSLCIHCVSNHGLEMNNPPGFARWIVHLETMITDTMNHWITYTKFSIRTKFSTMYVHSSCARYLSRGTPGTAVYTSVHTAVDLPLCVHVHIDVAAVPRWRVLCKTADFAEWRHCGLACSKSMTAGGPYFRQVAASAIGCWQQAFEGGRRRSLSSREGSPGANSAKAVFLSVLTQRHLRIILGTFGRYRQQPFDTHSVPVCTPNFSSASYYACQAY